MSAATAEKKTEAKNEIKAPSDAIQALAAAIGSTMTTTIEKGATEAQVTLSGDPTEANLPEDLTMAQIKRTQDYRTHLVAAGSLANAQAGLKLMEKNKDLNTVSTSFKFGNDTIETTIHRQKEFNDGKGGKLVKPGYISASVTAKGVNNTGELAKVRNQISNEAKSLFG